MWGGADQEDAVDTLYGSVIIGILTIDTAQVYSKAEKEALVIFFDN